ncbi:MAG: T9SS type A sorting domain-containing protein, partial [Thermonemataceae bacterium]|nr:T9SS type A sorting domain-containing protein [Thermonemataceae bacterium]
TGVTKGATTIIQHASGANAGISVGDIVFINNSVNGITQLRRMSGRVLNTTATTTELDINSTAFGNWTSNGQFTKVNPLETTRRTTLPLGVGLANGADYYIRWYLDNTGADELSLDNITLVADPQGLLIDNTDISTVIDFDNTLANVNNGQLVAAASFSAATPAAGELDANTWSFENDGATNTATAPNFGVVATNGQGVSIGGVATPGWYGFDIPNPASLDPAATTRALGWQGGDAAFATNGAVTLRITNNTGITVQDFRISYTAWEFNDDAGTNRIEVFASTDNATYTEITVGEHNSQVAASGSPAWVGTLYNMRARQASGLSAMSLAPGGSLYLKFFISGAGFDELAIDDISVIASVAPLTSLNPNRNTVWSYEGFDYYESLGNVQDVNNDGVSEFPSSYFKGVSTRFADFSPGGVGLHGVSTNTTNNRYASINGYASLGWAGDWLAGPDRDTPPVGSVFVPAGRDAGDPTIVKPTIPITSASEQRSIVNSGMYVQGGDGEVIGRRLQTSTAGFAFQYTATSTTNYQPCTSISADCPAISPLRHKDDVRVITHISTEANQAAGDDTRWSHTNNVIYGAEGSTVWVGVMLRKNKNDDDPVFISLHKNANVWEAAAADADPLNINAIQIGYFGGVETDPASGATTYRHWGVRVNGVVAKAATQNARITTAEDIDGLANLDVNGHPATVDGTGAPNPSERVFDLLVVRIDFAEGTAPTAADALALAGGLDNTYATDHRVRMWVLRDIARDNDSPNTEAYPAVPNPNGYPLGQGALLDILGSETATALDFDTNKDLDITAPAATDISFHSMAYFPGANTGASAMDEFRLGGSFSQAALNSPVISLIRGLCSANGGSLGTQSYQGGSFGEAECLDANGNLLPCAGGTTNSTSNSGTQEVYDAASTDIWGSAVTETTLENTWEPAGDQHPSYTGGAVANNVVRAPGAAQLYNGGPTYNKISGGAYNYQLNTGSGPNDNNYLMGTQSRHSFGPAWVAFYDNSPNKNGYLMSINAAYARSKFFDQTIAGLCADTQYEFSVDIINVLRDTRVITNYDPVTGTSTNAAIHVATDVCDPVLEPGCAQFSRAGSTGSFIGLGGVTRGGTGALGTTTGSGGNNRNFSLNPEIDFALNETSIYTVPVSIANDQQWHRVGLTFVTKANLSQALNLSMRNLAPGGMGNDLAIDNISFRPCGNRSELIDSATVCNPTAGGTAGQMQVLIGKAGQSYSNARVRFQKWTPFAYPISRMITGVTNTGTPTTVTLVNGGGATDYEATYGVPLGAEVALYDLNLVGGMPIFEGTTAIVTAKTATTVELGSLNNVTVYPGNVGTLQVLALTDAAVTNISQTNPVVVTFSSTQGDDIAVGTLVTFSGIAGMTEINGLSGKVTAKTSNTIIIGSIDASGFSAYVGSATERIALSNPSDDLDGDGVADENEYVDMDFNPYDGKNYSVVTVTPNAASYDTPLVPVTPVAIPRTITAYNVYYSNGTYFRALFAGNEANLLDESGKCRFIIPGFLTNCEILPATGGKLSARKTNDGIELRWNAYQENPSMKYILERSYDAKNFVAIADYSAFGKEEYKHLDGAPYEGKNYYRVKIVEANGSFQYSNTATADWGNSSALSIYPNPANDVVNVNFSKDFTQEQEVSVRVLSIMGNQIKDKGYTLPKGERNLVIDTKDIAEGLYLLEIKIGTLDKVVHKLVIKR